MQKALIDLGNIGVQRRPASAALSIDNPTTEKMPSEITINQFFKSGKGGKLCKACGRRVSHRRISRAN